MHLIIDDTYGPQQKTQSRYVTGNRRTHIAIAIEDSTVDYCREQLLNCVKFISDKFNINVDEFHFSDILNRRGVWEKLDNGVNLALIHGFASIYKNYKWPILIQTVDDRTFHDHNIQTSFGKNVFGFNTLDPSDLSLLLLLLKIKIKYKNIKEPLTLIVDEGKGKPDQQIGNELFHDFHFGYSGVYSSSTKEPLLQLADFVAFCVNRMTHLSVKKNRTETDVFFMKIVSDMGMVCDDLTKVELPIDFDISDFDAIHQFDRMKKNLK